jgi:ParB family chromosome partitioning protein
MSDRVGKKRSTIANYLRLLKLDPIIQTGIRDGFITMGHGRAIINIDDHDAQADIYQKIVLNNLSVRETEALVKSYHEGTPAPAEKATTTTSSFNVADDERLAITNFFGAKVDVKVDPKGKGKITIPFRSEEDFNRIIKLIKG